MTTISSEVARKRLSIFNTIQSMKREPTVVACDAASTLCDQKKEIFKRNEKYAEEQLKISFGVPNVEKVEICSSKWTEYPGCNIAGRLCALDEVQSNVTVLNVWAKRGGYLAPHTHDRLEMIFVIDGEYYDSVTGITHKRGEVVLTPAGKSHSFKSDYCLCTVVWVPAYPAEKI